MNKYQEALDKLTPNDWDIVHHKDGWWSCQIKAVTLIQELVDKATPKKPTFISYDDCVFICSSCNSVIEFEISEDHHNCLSCGQSLDWRKNEDK